MTKPKPKMKLWKAWVGGIPREGGGTIGVGEEFLATEDDPRVLSGSAQLLGDAKAKTTEPAPEVGDHLETIAASEAPDAPETAEGDDGAETAPEAAEPAVAPES